MKGFSIKYKLLLTVAGFLVIITLCNAVLTSYVINRRGEEEAFAQLSRQLRLFQNDLEEIRETQIAVALEAARDEKNLSDLAVLYAQALKLRQASGTVLEQSFSLNKATSLNRLQLIVSSARLSSAAVYLEGALSHYVTQDEAGMIVRRDGQDAMVSTNQKEDGNVQLATWRTWAESSLPVLVARRTPIVDRVTVAFKFPIAHLMVLQVVVPIQGVLRESFLETIAEHLTIAAPETLRQPQNDGQTPQVIGMFVFSKVFDTAFLKETATNTGLLPSILSPDGQHGMQLLDVGRVPAELLTAQNDAPIQSQTVKIGQTSYYQAFMPWWIDGQPALILGFALSREGVLATIRQTVIGITTAAGLILVIGGALGYLLIARLVMPITSLTAAVSAMEIDDADGLWPAEQEKTSHISLGRYLERPIAPQHGDEIGGLTRAFNALATQLYQSFATLEERVRSRTSELAIAKEQAEEAQRAAEAASQAKSDFLSNMSHELRTPLNGILGYAQLLKRQANLTPTQRSQVDVIQSSGKHLLTMINEILDLGKIEAHKVDVESVEFNLPAVLHHVYNLTKVQAEAKDLRVSYAELSPLPVVVRGDERKLTQILLNLLGNAVKYTQTGSVTLRISDLGFGISDLKKQPTPHPSQEGKSEIRNLKFEIEDTGVGIPQDQLETIFEPFTQVGETGKPTEGAGLGLAITRQLIDLMNGTLAVESEIGKGSTFTVDLPLPIVEGIETSAEKAETQVIGYTGERRRILVVDDNATNLSMIVALLEPLGFAIDTAKNGQEAVRHAVEHKPDLIVLDFVMPVMDGLEAAQEIREHSELQQIPIIGVSAAVVDNARKHAFVQACDDFLPKPVELDSLLDKIRTQLYLEWKTKTPDNTGFPGGAPEEQVRQDHIPPNDVLDRLYDHVKRGDYDSLEAILEHLMGEESDYATFCKRLSTYAERYDRDAILRYIRELKGGNQ